MAEPTPQQIDEVLRRTPAPSPMAVGTGTSVPAAASGEPTPEQLEAVLREASGSAYSRATEADKGQAVLTGMGTGAVAGATVAGSTVAGMRAGAALPVPPQARLPAIAAGGVLGFGAGMTGSSYLNSLLESQIPPRYLNDPSLVPYYQGGRTFGEVIGGAPMVFGLPLMQGNRVANFISNVGVQARATPKGTGAQEFFSAAGAGTLGGASLAYNPESEVSRFAAETVGGLFSPPKMLMSAAQNAQSISGGIMARFSEGSREQMAANYLNTILRQAGEDPNKLIERLLEPLPAGVPTPTGGQKTGSLALQVLETTLGKENPVFRSRLDPQGRAAFQAYQVLVDDLRRIGDPEALQQAARMERSFFNDRLTERLTTAEQNAASRIARIRVDSPQTRANVGRIVQEEVENALADAREYETALWRQAELEAVDVSPGAQGLDDAVITPRLLSARGSSAGILDVVTSVTPEYLRSMPGYSTVRGIMSRFGVNQNAMEAYEQGKLTTQYIQTREVPAEYVTNVKEIPVSYMVKARSDLLSLSRAAASSGDANTARIYGEMAEAMMSDMDKLQLPAYDRAREYSNELNDFFTRTYARELTASMRTGARKLPPEIIVARAFNSNNDITSQRMVQAMNAAGGLNTRYQRLLNELGPDHPQVLELAPFARDAAQRTVSVADAQRQWLLLGANKALKPDASSPTGVKLNQGMLNQFIAENERYLSDVGILEDLKNVNTAENTLRMVTDQNSAFNKGIEKQAAFALALGYEDPVRVVTEALNGRTPARSMQRITAMARNNGRNAVDGLKSTLYDYAFTSAGGMSNNFSPTAYYDTLFNPISRNQPSLIQLMTQSGMMTQREKNGIRRLLLPMVQIESAMGNRQQLENLLGQDQPSVVQDLSLRVIGSRLGASLGKGSGDSLVLAGAGSRIARDYFENQPSLLIKNILERAAQDPQMLAMLLQRSDPNSQTTAELRRKLAAQMGLNGLSAGLPAVINPIQYEPPPEGEPVGAFSSGPQPRPQPPAPSTRGSPVSPAPPPQSAAPQGSVNPSSREMLQQLFPFDAMLGA